MNDSLVVRFVESDTVDFAKPELKSWWVHHGNAPRCGDYVEIRRHIHATTIYEVHHVVWRTSGECFESVTCFVRAV